VTGVAVVVLLAIGVFFIWAVQHWADWLETHQRERWHR